MKVKINKKDLDILINLEERLLNNYNNGSTFKQHEEDRLIIGYIIDQALSEIRKEKRNGRNI